MNTITFTPDSPIERLRRDDPLYTACGLFLIALMVPTLAAQALDERTLLGVSVWDKPLKFQLALAVYILTLAFTARFVPAAKKETRSYRWFTAAVVFAIVAETVWISGAAAFGIASHFNFATPYMGTIYLAMGGFATLLTAATTHQAWLIHRNADTGLAPLVHSGLVWGLGLTLPLTLITAGALSSGALPGAEGHFVGGAMNDANGVPFFHWARDGGDLRVAHFFATHALHAVPIAAWAAHAMGFTSKRWGWLAAALWTALVALTFIQAIAGLPFPGR